MSRALQVYSALSKFPFGKHIFSKAVSFNAPYFSTIKPVITSLKPGLCSIEMKERRRVHNHLGTVHAIAMCNLCELTMGMALEATIPPDLRWIPKGMSVRYLKKAKGKLTGKSLVDRESLKPGDIDIPIEVINTSGEIVADAVITVYISERRSS
jgi:acyl-coenzyme A thioesterase PaaI-like protein